MCVHYHSDFPLSITQYRVVKTHRMPYFCSSISAKELYNLWLICRKRPARQGINGSAPPCTVVFTHTMHMCMYIFTNIYIYNYIYIIHIHICMCMYI